MFLHEVSKETHKKKQIAGFSCRFILNIMIVVFYVQKHSNDEHRIILISNNKNKNEELAIKADHIEKITETSVSYWKDKENDKKTTSVTVSKNPTVFYNGVVVDLDEFEASL